MAQKESVCRGRTVSIGVDEGFCMILVWGLLAFLLLLVFRFPRFLLPLWVRFLGRVAGCTLINLTAFVGVIVGQRLPNTGARASFRTVLTVSFRALAGGCSDIARRSFH